MSSFDLEPGTVDLQVRGPSAPLLKDRIEFGGPLVTPIDSSYPGDADLRTFVRGFESKLRFFLVHMSVNFPPSYPPPLTRASVQVTLADDVGGDEAIAYSLFPTRLGTAYEVSKGFALSPTLTVGPVGGGLGSVTRGTMEHGTRDFVVGGPELSPHPAWIFQPTSAQALVGSTRLVMIIQLPVARKGTLAVSLSAEVEQGRFRKRRIPLPGASDVDPQVIHL